MKCKKCGDDIDDMVAISKTPGSTEAIKLIHGPHITICGSCRWYAFKIEYIPREQYQQWIDTYCRKYWPINDERNKNL